MRLLQALITSPIRVARFPMSYRSIKRVLGETSLERKCRLLFGACLLLLIGGAFWGIDRIASRLGYDHHTESWS